MAVLYAHLHETRRSSPSAGAALPAGLDAVIAKAIDKSPDRRFASCGS